MFIFILYSLFIYLNIYILKLLMIYYCKVKRKCWRGPSKFSKQLKLRGQQI